jgi:hypothetical protein
MCIWQQQDQLPTLALDLRQLRMSLMPGAELFIGAVPAAATSIYTQLRTDILWLWSSGDCRLQSQHWIQAQLQHLHTWLTYFMKHQ